MGKWWKEDWTDELCIVALIVLATITAFSSNPKDTSTFTLPAATALVGYMKGKKTVVS